ncbi:hypothetical protein Salat_1593700 [Sesamum alatum]|uniref:Uncharacterized protein n=1 Tax=Sesamum alatum TaxID=300844 RepID=A0AAE1Y6I0_9LAMI|nr:hypothetical protein Salat_1593700 [Sesamum alatum]
MLELKTTQGGSDWFEEAASGRVWVAIRYARGSAKVLFGTLVWVLMETEIKHLGRALQLTEDEGVRMEAGVGSESSATGVERQRDRGGGNGKWCVQLTRGSSDDNIDSVISRDRPRGDFAWCGRWGFGRDSPGWRQAGCGFVRASPYGWGGWASGRGGSNCGHRVPSSSLGLFVGYYPAPITTRQAGAFRREGPGGIGGQAGSWYDAYRGCGGCVPFGQTLTARGRQ